MNLHLGHQFLVEYYNCCQDIIDDENKILNLLTQSAKLANATIVTSTFHKFAPQGVSGVVVIEESHFAIHTWPEHNYVSLDIFSCGENIDAQKAIKFLNKEFKSSKYEIQKIKRGDILKINSNVEKIK
jgi:S-adenosylmethionine decarboxylase